MTKTKTSLKQSYYNFTLELDDSSLLIYNTKSGAIAHIDQDEASDALNALENLQDDSVLELDITKQLNKAGFLIEENKNEIEDIKKWHEKYKTLETRISMTLLPAEACNFACPYCFIYEQRPLIMEDWVYDAVYTYLEEQAKEHGEKLNLHFTWYGGEPLLAADKILNFMPKLNGLVDKYNIKLSSSILTNGYLLNIELFEQFIKLGISSYQITVDGTKENHDKLRFLKTDNSGTFDTIWKNILYIKKSELDFSLSIRANFLKTNLDIMNDLLELYSQDIGDDKRFNLYYRPVYHFETTRNDIETINDELCSSDEGVKLQTELAFKTLKKLNKEIDYENRIFNPLPQPTWTWCESEREKSYILGADGLIFSCDTLFTDKEHSIGEITREGKISLKKDEWKKWKGSFFDDTTINQCLKCKQLPLCFGGCRRSRFASGNFHCFWTEDIIYNSMKRYSQYLLKSSK